MIIVYKQTYKILLPILLFSFFYSGIIQAQIDTSKLPITIDAESTGYLGDQSILTFKDLRLSQGDISISSDKGQASKLDFENSTWKFEGNVKIILKNGKVESSSAFLEFEKHQIKTAIISGNQAIIEFRREGENSPTLAKANRIDYDFEKDIVDFSGDVTIEEDGNQISSDYLVYNINNQTIQAQSNNKDNPKVKITYTPRMKNKEETETNSIPKEIEK
jgi:lipopolysaccharide transport protein LptA